MTAEPVVITEPEGHVADSRPECYEENGAIVIRASALGGCIRNLVAARMGIKAVPFNDTALMRMNEGNIHEPHILRHLGSLGLETVSTQDELELTIAEGRIIIRGHSDGRVVATPNLLIPGVIPGQQYVVEAKAMGRDVWNKWTKKGWPAFRRYLYQFGFYQHVTGLPGIFAAKNRDTGEIDVTVWSEPVVPLIEVKARAIKAAAAVELPECDPVQFPCSRYFIHTDSRYTVDPLTGFEIKKSGDAPEPHEVPDEHVAAFEELARAYREARKECDQAESKRKELSAQLLGFLKQLNLTKGVTARCIATEVTRTDRRLDQKRLKEERPDIAEQYTVETSARYPKVTWRENEDEKED